MATIPPAQPQATTEPAPENPPQAGPAPPSQLDLLSSHLFTIVSVLLLFVSFLFIAGLFVQARPYIGGLSAALSGAPSSTTIDNSAVLTYARGLGSAILKTSALFFGFILILTGSLYVLRTAQAAYDVSLTGGKMDGTLHTSSPGLVIVTLGVVLSIFALYSKTDLVYQQTITSQTTPAAAPPSDQPAGPWIPATTPSSPSK